MTFYSNKVLSLTNFRTDTWYLREGSVVLDKSVTTRAMGRYLYDNYMRTGAAISRSMRTDVLIVGGGTHFVMAHTQRVATPVSRFYRLRQYEGQFGRLECVPMPCHFEQEDTQA